MALSFGQLLREFRQRRTISQEELARRVYVSQSTISRFESGRQEPDQASAEMLDAALDAGGTLVTSMSSGPRLLDADEQARLAFAEASPSRADLGTVRTLDALLSRLRLLITEHGTEPVARTVLEHQQLIETLVRESRGGTRAEIVKCGARWAHLFGWLHVAARRGRRAEQWSARSMEWCVEADEPSTMFSVLLLRGHSALARGHAAMSIGLSQAAQRNHEVYPAQLAYAALQEAWGHAVHGDASMVDRRLEAANEMLTGLRDGARVPSMWAEYYLSDGFWLIQQGRVYRTLGRADKAEDLFAAAEDVPGAPRWWRDYCRADLKELRMKP